MSTPDDETRRDVEAALAARRELGLEYEEALAAGLLDRVNQLALMRASEVRRDAERGDQVATAAKDAQHKGFVLGIVSVGVGIPITAISGALVDPSLAGVLVSWAGIVGVNIAAALRPGRRPPSTG